MSDNLPDGVTQAMLDAHYDCAPIPGQGREDMCDDCDQRVEGFGDNFECDAACDEFDNLADLARRGKL